MNITDQIKIMLSAWYQEVEALNTKLDESNDDADTFYRLSCEKERLNRCVRELESIVYEGA